jgi:hypothetical protein
LTSTRTNSLTGGESLPLLVRSPSGFTPRGVFYFHQDHQRFIVACLREHPQPGFCLTRPNVQALIAQAVISPRPNTRFFAHVARTGNSRALTVRPHRRQVRVSN